MTSWLKNRLPKAAQCRERLGIHRWGIEDDSRGRQPGWGKRIVQGMRRRFDDPRIWHLNRRSVAGAVAIGLFIGWLPMPGQMIVAACCAALLRVHVPLSVVMVWFTNPLTVAPLGYVAWRSGSMLLNSPAPTFDTEHVSLHALAHMFQHAWPEILTGCLFAAALSAVVGYLITLGAWRICTIRRWRGRRRLSPG